MSGLPLAILISGASIRNGESSLLADLFEVGLQRLHLRKPDSSASDVARIIIKIPETYHKLSFIVFLNCSKNLLLLVIITILVNHLLIAKVREAGLYTD